MRPTEGTRAGSGHLMQYSKSLQALHSILYVVESKMGCHRERDFSELLKTLRYPFPLCTDEQLVSKSRGFENPSLKIPKYLHPHISWKNRSELLPLTLWSHKDRSHRRRATHKKRNHLPCFKEKPNKFFSYHHLQF